MKIIRIVPCKIKNKKIYKLVVSRKQKKNQVIEKIGTFNKTAGSLSLNIFRLLFWLSKNVSFSWSASDLLTKALTIDILTLDPDFKLKFWEEVVLSLKKSRIKQQPAEEESIKKLQPSFDEHAISEEEEDIPFAVLNAKKTSDLLLKKSLEHLRRESKKKGPKPWNWRRIY